MYVYGNANKLCCCCCCCCYSLNSFRKWLLDFLHYLLDTSASSHTAVRIQFYNRSVKKFIIAVVCVCVSMPRSNTQDVNNI